MMKSPIEQLIADACALAYERGLHEQAGAHNGPAGEGAVDRMVRLAAERAHPMPTPRRPWREGSFGALLDAGVAISEAERLTGHG